MRRVFLNFHVLVFILLFAGTVSGQPLNPGKELSQYNLDHWTNDNLPSSLLQMIQTSDGYLWMASYHSLVRFDGVKATVFDKFTTPSIRTNGFKCVYEDPHKNFWAGSIGGGLLLRQKKSFKTFAVPFGLSSNNIENIFSDSNDNLWLCTLRGLVLFKDSVFTLITPSGYPPETELTIFDVAEDKDGALWLGTSNGVFKYSQGELKKQTWQGVNPEGEISSVLFDINQTMWIGSYGNGVYKVENNALKRVPELSSFIRITSIIEDRSHSVWIISENGVARVNKHGVSFLGTDNGLSHNNVTAICEDHEGSIWLGTYYGGLDRLRDGTFTNYTTDSGLPHNTIHSIFQSRDSTVWVGTESNLAYLKSGKFNKLSFPELAGARVRDVQSDSDDNLWIATYNGLFKLKNNKLTKYATRDGLSSEQVRIIFEDNQKRLWIGTRNGLTVYEGGKWKTYSEKDGLLNDFIMSIIQLNDGTIAVGTNSGLFLFNGKGFDSFKTDAGETVSLTFLIYQDKEGILWMGSNTGFICIKDKKLYSFSNDNRLLGGNIYQVLEDHLGMMWLTSDRGIIRIQKKRLLERIKNSTVLLEPQLFDKSSGLRTNEVTATSHAIITFDRKIWFPTLGGIAVVEPSNILINKIPPPITIEKILVGGKEYDLSGPISLPSGSRNIEIHYTALSFMIPQKVQYKYMLEGYDDQWYAAGDRRVAQYTSLLPGEYTFKIAASNNDSVWNTEEEAIVFQVEKAFWQSWIFYITVPFVICLIIFGIVDYRIRSIKTLNRILDDRIAERTHEVLQQKEEIESQRDYIEAKHNELEKARNLIAEQYDTLREVNSTLEGKVEERTRALQKAYSDLIQANEELDYFVYKSAHDIKGPLARLQGLCNLAIMEAPDETSRNYMTILQKESVLANRVIQKLSHANEIKNMEVEISTVHINDMVYEIINQLTSSHPEASNVKFAVEADKNSILYTDARLLQELFFNLLENAVVFQSDQDQQVSIRSITENEAIIISIRDNGIGIDERMKKEVFKMFVKGSEKSVGLGLGLYITKKATEKLHGSVELKDIQSGTEFEIKLPVRITVEGSGKSAVFS